MSTNTKTVIGYAMVLAVAASLPLKAASPAGVSPGAIDNAARIASRCPTFSWGEVAEAESYQLVVYRISAGDGVHGVRTERENRVLDARLPRGARTWTPNRGQCLNPGTYVWHVRGASESSAGTDEHTEWSRGLIFSIPEPPSESEILDALRSVYPTVEATGSSVREALPPSGARSLNSSAFKSSEAGSSITTSAARALAGHNDSTAGSAHGVIGVTDSGAGAGSVAANTSGGADLVIDGSWDVLPDILFTESGIDKRFGSAQVFNIQNSGPSGMAVLVDGRTVTTAATEKDTFADVFCLPDESPRWNGVSWGCAEVGLITSVASGSGLDGGGSSGPVTVGIQSAAVTSAHLASNSVGASEIASNSVTGADIVNGTIVYSDTNTSSVQRRVTGSCATGMSSVTSTGQVNCHSDDFLTAGIGAHLVAETFNGNITANSYDDWHMTGPGAFCFLTFVQLRDVDGGSEDASCNVFPYPGQPWWRLVADSEFGDDADAKCQARCYNFY